MNISLVSSFYRVQAHLPAWVARAESVAAAVQRAGIALEFVIIANDAQPEERTLIEAFAAHVRNVQVHYVPRESLYASWNRGVEAATGQLIGFWNADDSRSADALIDAWKLAKAGAQVVYFPWTNVWLKDGQESRTLSKLLQQPAALRDRQRKFYAGPFFMFTPAVYRMVGAFDVRFRITGDWEWINRALAVIDFTPSAIIGGEFFVHGGNLSSTGTSLQICEENVVRILSGLTDQLRPAPPDQMRDVWSLWEWDVTLPPEASEALWGSGAAEAWARWQTDEPQRQAAVRKSRWRAFPRWLIDTLRLRPLLARFGLVKARTSTP